MKNRTDLLNFIAEKIEAKSYLEIGIYDGINFDSIKVDNKIGVDPNVKREDVVELDSDSFFKVESESYDLIFIDGDHSHQQSLKDLTNSLEHLNDGGVIVMHDAFPDRIGLTGVRKTPTSEWCGDVYQTVMWARQQPNLGVITWKEDYGCAIITKGSLKAVDKPKMDLTFENLHKNPIDSVGLVNTNELREYFDIYMEVSKIEEDKDYYSMTREELKEEYKSRFPENRIGRKSDETLIMELTNG